MLVTFIKESTATVFQLFSLSEASEYLEELNICKYMAEKTQDTAVNRTLLISLAFGSGLEINKCMQVWLVARAI